MRSFTPILRATLGTAALLCLPGALAAQDRPVLTVMAYDSFTAEWGPGPAIRTAFEAECDCEVRFIPAGDGAAMLSRLRLEGARSPADVVVGLDSSLMGMAAETGLFEPHGLDGLAFDLPVAWDDSTFLPFDWSWFAFVYDRTKIAAPPASFPELARSDLKIAIQDPRSSTPGLGLLLWVKAAWGDEAGEIWHGLSDNILTVTKGWTESYNLFLDGEADMVLSYVTSPAFHLMDEGDTSKAAALFDEGNYLQIEVAARTVSSAQPELAQEFLRFLVGDTAQGILPTTNWMFPAVIPAAGLALEFEALPRPAKSLLLPEAEVEALRGPALEEWRDELSR